MKFVSTHERKVRGEPVHITKEEKEKLEEKKSREYKEIEADIEAEFLVPRSKNFVETEEVKEYIKRIMLWLKTGYPIHIIGPTGCGKTALAVRIAEKLGRNFVWINGDEQVITSDLVGGYSRISMEVVRDKFIHNVYKDKDVIEPTWVFNPLALACKHGYTLIYNEFSRARPEANNILLSVLEEGILELPTKFGEERYIKVHPDFRLILTSNNIEYAGVHKPQDALLDRLITIYMDYYDRITEISIVRAHSKIEQEKAEKIVDLVRTLRNKFSGAEKPGIRPSIMIAQGLRVASYNDKRLVEQLCIDAVASKAKSLEDIERKRKIVREEIEKLGIK